MAASFHLGAQERVHTAYSTSPTELSSDTSSTGKRHSFLKTVLKTVAHHGRFLGGTDNNRIF